MVKDWVTPSRSSPSSGSGRACLCPDGKYSKKCCNGTLQAQGIGSITGIQRDISEEWQGINTEWNNINKNWNL
jgi:hypothetical protein